VTAEQRPADAAPDAAPDAVTVGPAVSPTRATAAPGAPRPGLPTRLRAALYMVPGILLFLLNGVPFLLALAAGELGEAYDGPLQAIAVGVIAVIGVVLVVLGVRVLRTGSTTPRTR
jgi:hypothetical protein